MISKRAPSSAANYLLGLQITTCLLACFGGLSAGYWMRFHTPLRAFGILTKDASYTGYLPLLLLGSALLVGTFVYLNLYTTRTLLRPHRALSTIFKGLVFWFLLFLSTSLILKFEPHISRVFVAVSCITTLAIMSLWYRGLYLLMTRSRWRDYLIQRVVLLGWSAETARLVSAINKDRNHPYEIAGLVTTDEPGSSIATGVPQLGSVDQLEVLLQRNATDIVVLADLEITREQMLEIAAICERHYVAFKVIPSFFQIFVSNLQMQTISGVPILGVETLAVRTLFNRICKRSVDVVGGAVGLFGSLPLMLLLAWRIHRESPGPILFRQIRTGQSGRPFTIYKMRSMRLDAESKKGAQWAVENDPRRLKIGAFMREWNLDELPQFWNVLIGDMSLVGPRPERPELIAQFEKEIPHYNPRHEVRPGLTGWAQVNGLRGNTSLVERIRYDLYYIENWTFFWDFQIMLLTFFKRQNAY